MELKNENNNNWMEMHNGDAGFRLTGAYFGGRAYITSILKNHTRAYFQGNRIAGGLKRLL